MTAQVLNVPKPEWLDQEDVNIFDGAVRGFIEKECLPHGDRWAGDCWAGDRWAGA